MQSNKSLIKIKINTIYITFIYLNFNKISNVILIKIIEMRYNINAIAKLNKCNEIKRFKILILIFFFLKPSLYSKLIFFCISLIMFLVVTKTTTTNTTINI